MNFRTVYRSFCLLLLAAAAAAVGPAWSQGTLLQGGPWASGRAPMYVGSGSSQAVVQDSGPAGGGPVGVGLSELLLTARGTGTPPYVGQGTGPFGTNFCDYDAPLTNPSGYHFLCISPNTTQAGSPGGVISYGAGGGATALPLSLCVNGTCSTPTGAVPFVISPPSGTNTQGLVINQTTPNFGSVTGPVLLNELTVIDRGGQTVYATGLDSFGQINNQLNAFRINYRVTGGTTTHGALSVATDVTGANGGTYGVGAGVYQNVVAIGGTSWGILGYGNVGPTGSAGTIIGLEAEMLIATGGSATNRIGLSINTQGPVAASGIDAAIVLDALPNFAPWDGTPAPFHNFVLFSNNLYGANSPAISISGSIFDSDVMTIDSFAKFNNVDILGKIFNFKNVSVPGNIAGFTLPPQSEPGAFQFGGQGAAGISMELDSFTGPARFTGLRANGSSTAPTVILSGQPIAGLTVLGYTGTSGAGGYNEVGSVALYAAQNFTSSNNGSYWTFTTIALNANVESEIARIQQGLMVGTTTDPGAGKIDAANGYKSGGTAGVSCVVNTPAHITVVNGIVTLCN